MALRRRCGPNRRSERAIRADALLPAGCGRQLLEVPGWLSSIELSLMSRNDYNRPCYVFLQFAQLPVTWMEIPLHQLFEKQRLQGAVHQATDLEELKGLTQQLIDLYFKQKAATAWVIADKS